ncbi:MAG: alpha/beta hydrolase [bacterium]
MKKIKIKIKGIDRDLAAQLDVPDSMEFESTAIFAHCFTCTKDLKSITNISEGLNSGRIAVLRFDFTGLGGSTGDFSKSSFATNIEDLIHASKFLEENYQATELLIGHSLGGAAVIQVADKISSVKAVATIAAPYYPEHLENIINISKRKSKGNEKVKVTIAGRQFEISNEFYHDLDEKTMKQKIQNLNKPLCILHSPLDEIVGIEHATKIFVTAKHPKSFISLNKADHLLLNPDDSKYAGRVIAEWASLYI